MFRCYSEYPRRNAPASSSRFGRSGVDVVFGIHPVSAAVATGSREVLKAFVMVGSDADDDSVIQASILPILRKGGTHVVRVDRSTLDSISKNGVHQGIAIECSPIQPTHLEAGEVVRPDDFDAPMQRQPTPATEATTTSAVKHHPLLVALDEIVDPHNVGAVMRSSLLLGADGMLLGLRNAAPLGPTTSKTSSGAMEVWAAAKRLYTCNSMHSTLGSLSEAGWHIIGTAAPPADVLQRQAADVAEAAEVDSAAAPDGDVVPDGSGSTSDTPSMVDTAVTQSPAGEVPPSKRQRWVSSHALIRDRPTILVMGSEGRGLRPAVRKACHSLAYIPMADPWNVITRNVGGQQGRERSALVESLNVSAAASILLHQLRPRVR